MSNLLKQYYVVRRDEDKRVINSNGLAEEKIREFAANMKGADGFSQGLEAQQVEAEPQPSAEEVARQILTDAREQADQLLNDAHAQTKQILEEAKEQAAQLCEQQKAVGYAEGAKAREEELAEREHTLQKQAVAMEEDLQSRKEEMESEYQSRLGEMEADIVDALIPVFDKVFHIQFADQREILLALVSNTLMNVEVGDKLRIRVNEADKNMLAEHIEEIREQAGDVMIELIQDTKLADGQCQIETAYGVYDCGIDTQFDNLVKNIRSLV